MSSKVVLTFKGNILTIFGHQLQVIPEQPLRYKPPGGAEFLELADCLSLTADFIKMYEAVRWPQKITKVVCGPTGLISLLIERKVRPEALQSAEINEQEIVLRGINFLNEEYTVLVREDDQTGWIDSLDKFHLYTRPSIEVNPG